MKSIAYPHAERPRPFARVVIGTAAATMLPVALWRETQSMMRRPHEDYDVIVHYCRQRGTDGVGHDTWTISHGREKHGERDSLEAATELACDLAAVYRRPAWLLDETGYPLKPIERRAANWTHTAGSSPAPRVSQRPQASGWPFGFEREK